MSNRYDEHLVFHVVYFVQNTNSGHIKIGTTKSMGARLNTLQNASADPLLVMACMPGDHRHEAELHDRFRSSRLHREWFAQTPELLAYISEVAGRGVKAVLPPVVVTPPKPTLANRPRQTELQPGDLKAQAQAAMRTLRSMSARALGSRIPITDLFRTLPRYSLFVIGRKPRTPWRAISFDTMESRGMARSECSKASRARVSA